MTATRWWVRMAARWLARIGGVQGHLNLAMLTLTGISTASITLRQYGHGELAWPLIGTIGIAIVGYTYAYTEGGVWNQVARDRMDLSKNFADPRIAIDDITIAAGVFGAREGRPPTEEEMNAIEQAVRMSYDRHRDGIDWMEDDQ